MRIPPTCVLGLAIAACSQHAANAPAPAASVRFGVYRFSERPDGVKDPIQGRVLVREDTVVVEVESRSCRYVPQNTQQQDAFVYDCGDVGLAFNRLQPITGAQYRASKTVVDRTATCVRYTTDRSGNQVCTQQHMENVERRVPFAGTLHLAFITNP